MFGNSHSFFRAATGLSSGVRPLRRLVLVTAVAMAVFISLPGKAQAQSYRYIDESGNINFVDRLSDVPFKYRYQIIGTPTPSIGDGKHNKGKKIKDKKKKEKKEKKKKEKKEKKKKKGKKGDAYSTAMATAIAQQYPQGDQLPADQNNRQNDKSNRGQRQKDPNNKAQPLPTAPVKP